MSTTLAIGIGITGLTNVKALPYSPDMTTVWNGTALVAVAGATPAFLGMSEVEVNSVGSGTYSVALPAGLEGLDLWIAVHDAGDTPAVSDPLYGSIDDPCNVRSADALLDRADGIETGKTLRQALRIMAGVLAGKVSGAGTGVETFKGVDGSTPRVEITVDASGNRTAVEYDPT